MLRMMRALRSKNACKTCALGMGGQLGGMVNEEGRFPEVCKKSIQAMAADMQGAVHEHFFDDFNLERLRGFSSCELEAAGRLTQPVYAGPLDQNYRKFAWHEAIDKIVKKMRAIEPGDAFFYFSGRSSNEAAFLLQLMARAWGTNNVSNCSYYCHQASGVALADAVGSGTATVTLDDLDSCDLIFLVGGNPASNHPRLMRSLVKHRRRPRNGKIIVINPLRELGLVRFNVPSDPMSLLFGSKIADEYVQPHIGGDIALLTGVAKSLFERGAVDRTFAERCTEGCAAFEQSVAHTNWDDIVRESGVDRAVIEKIAEMYANSSGTIFMWTMGITHHAHGVGNVHMIANLAMLRGMLGRPGAGLLPLRGHSNVQGIGSIGAVPTLKPAIARKMEEMFQFKLPSDVGLDTLASLKKAEQGGFKLAFCLGGNLFGSTPDAAFARRAMSKIDTMIYLNTTLNTTHVSGRGRETIILPVLARDEEAQPTTQESMFNYVRMSEGGPSRHEGPRSESDVVAAIAEQLPGASALDWKSLRSHANIRAAIATIIPGYAPIQNIDATRKEFHVEGRTIHKPTFPTESGKAKFHIVPIPDGGGASPTYSEGSSAEEEGGQCPAYMLRLMTVRSEGQFNTVVYEEEDIYRHQTRRDVILLHADDIARLGLKEDDRVTVRSSAGMLRNVLVREFDVRPGNAAMYFPEANVLVPTLVDERSRTPAYKNVSVAVVAERSAPGLSQSPPPGPNGSSSPDEPASKRAERPPKRDLKAC
jgi:molybdopterin-dependent oxidoreductase alpha subunit